MSRIIEEDGDILKVPGHIVHQVYCVVNRNKAAGLAEKIRKHLGANDYDRKKHAIPGTIREDGKVIHFRSQYYPGKASRVHDTVEKRLEWFKKCLEKLREWIEIHKPFRINFPEKIGCGLAGGDWTNYLKLIEDFSRIVPDFCEIYIIKFKK